MRLKSLDALRGVAALVVVFHHCSLLFYNVPPVVSSFPLSIIFAGKGAVSIFFALSGFVLFLSIKSGREFSYVPYVIRRICRIYIPFLFAIMFSSGLYFIAKPEIIYGLSQWFNYKSWQLYPSLGVVMAHLAMTDSSQYQSLDNVMWSLVHELRISIIFPFLAACISWNWKASLSFSLILSLVGTYCAGRFLFLGIFDPAATLGCLFLFAAGAVVFLKLKEISNIMGRMSNVIIAFLTVGALFLITLKNFYGAIAWLPAVFLVVVSATNIFAIKILSFRPLEWLGDVSYSLYLVHLPILLFLTHTLNGLVEYRWIIVLVIAASLAVADLAHRFIERPSITLGKKLAGRWARARAAKAILE